MNTRFFFAVVVLPQERSGLEAQHKNKINAEINRYQAMVQEKEELNKKWDEEVQTIFFFSYGFSRVAAFVVVVFMMLWHELAST